jgi:hypothetical protein
MTLAPPAWETDLLVKNVRPPKSTDRFFNTNVGEMLPLVELPPEVVSMVLYEGISPQGEFRKERKNSTMQLDVD